VNSTTENSTTEIRRDNQRILVIEDEPAARQATQRYLQYCGYEVETASTAAMALQKASQFEPRVLICDCKLGDRNDGIDIAREIQNRFGSVVIFVTAWSLRDVRGQFKGIDVKECLRKPVRLGKLADVINTVFTR
jgi:two-component system response regulator MprA